jgi:hypothetical protein
MSRYRRCPGINETPVEDELFLIAGDSGDIFHLDQLAMAIWRALEVPAGKAELLALFREVFPETPAETIEQDLEAAFSTLLDGDLIELCD